MNLDDFEIYTVTIVRNIGVPISFTVRRWKVLFIMFAALFFVGMFIYGSIQYFLLKTENEQISNTLARTNKRLSILVNQVSKKVQERYWDDENQRIAEKEAIKSELLKQPEFSTDGVWVTNRNSSSRDQPQSGAAVEIAKTTISRRGDELKIRVTLRNSSVPSQAVGGYLVITLINNDVFPTTYEAATGGPLGELGFPLSFKSGRQYYLKSKTGTRNITLKYALKDSTEFFTNVALFIYSYKGSLLARKSISIDKKIFLK